MNLKKVIPLLVLATVQANAATMVFHANKFSRQLQSSKEVAAEVRAGLVTELSFNLQSLDHNATRMQGQAFTTLATSDLTVGGLVGEPALPFKAVIVPGAPSDIEVSLDLGSEERLSGVKPAPAQREISRADADKIRPLAFSRSAYNKTTSLYRIESLGDFRGVQYSRVIVSPMSYDGVNGELVIYPALKASVLSRGETKSSEIFSNMKEEVNAAYDYLIIAPKALQDGLTAFIQWKRKFGHTLKLVTLEDLASTGTVATSADLNKFIKAEYADNKFTYALLVGSEKLMPTNYVKTSGSSRTPSDAAYFIMGDATDFIPDVYHARLVSESLADVKNQTSKWIAYESASMPNTAGFGKSIGIGSNEGSNPSDKEYIQQITKRLNEKAGTVAAEFFQDAANSTPAGLNAAFNTGALWTVYIGHGSGTSWPSMTKAYSTTNIAEMNNASAVKPVLIDIACQNGKLLKGNFGERMVNAVKGDDPIGVAGYYGGSVNISWHPPAILARGVVYNYFDKKLESLGESLFSGHLYLAQNHSDKNELIYNYRWFHLFGDPAMKLRDKAPITGSAAIEIKEIEADSYKLYQAGKVLANATITLFDKTEEKSIVVKTDKNGEFSLEAKEMAELNHFYHWSKNQGLSKYAIN